MQKPSRKLLKLSSVDIAWLAGLFEGEGSFSLHTRRTHKYPGAKISMTDRDVIQRVADLLGRNILGPYAGHPGFHGVVSPSKTYKDLYQVTVYGPTVVGFMMTVYSFMGERRKARIREILKVWRGASSGG